ncbi:MAG: GNAT family N-acetyltransferase [Hyphomicrobiales bacterium]
MIKNIMTKSITIRNFDAKDAAEAAILFYNSIRIGTVDYYNKSQRHAWAVKIPDTDNWCARLTSQQTFIAEFKNQIIGFMTIDDNGYIDLAFVSPNQIRIGVASMLYAEVEKYAIKHRLNTLTTQASLMAKPFFNKMGWLVVEQQTIIRQNIPIDNFLMEKSLAI